MSEKEHPPIQPDIMRSEIPEQPDPAREARELLEKPPQGKSEPDTEEKIASIRKSLHAEPDNGGSVPPPIETNPTRPATKIEYCRAVAYEKLIDPLLEKVRGLITKYIPQDSSVVDIGCGTGALAFRLAKENGCSVHGVDLATGKIARANDRKANANFPKVQFSEADATKLEGISDQQFDCATMSLFLHSLPENVRHQVLQEAMRVAKRIVIADYVTKQPRSFSGLAVKGIERFAGGEHFQSFKQFSEGGGLETLLEKIGLKIVEEQLNPSKTVRVVVVKRQQNG